MGYCCAMRSICKWSFGASSISNISDFKILERFLLWNNRICFEDEISLKSSTTDIDCVIYSSSPDLLQKVQCFVKRLLTTPNVHTKKSLCIASIQLSLDKM